MEMNKTKFDEQRQNKFCWGYGATADGALRSGHVFSLFLVGTFLRG
jgi:hypothetical protein